MELILTVKAISCILWFQLCMFHYSSAINCYQCTGSDPSDPFQCNEWLDADIDIKPETCDHFYGAKYCVKHVGRYEALALNCYQCSASETMDCSDKMIHMGGIEPMTCDHVFEAQYCIKSVGGDGGIGAKRFCSAYDLGNYCNYVEQPGDKLEYRTCIFTCSTDGCNSSDVLTPQKLFYSLFAIVLLCYYRYCIR